MALVMDWSEPITKEFLEKMVEGGSARIQVYEDWRMAMVPAGMARKQRIRAMEKTAADKGLTDATRRQAWNEAGKLKAVEKQAARNRHKLINGPGGLAEAAKIVSREVETGPQRGGRVD